MKLGSVREGQIYVTQGSTVGTWNPETGFQEMGRLPNPPWSVSGFSTSVATSSAVRRLLKPVTGRYSTTHVWAFDEGSFLATFGRFVFRSRDGGSTWHLVHELPPSSGPMGVLPTSFCSSSEKLLLSEYAFKEDEARILVSEDRGLNWSIYFESAEYRHFHGLFSDPYTGQIWGTTGDADRESSIGRFADGEYRELGRGTQTWRAVGLAFTPTSIIWGMDCSYCEDVHVLRLRRDEIEETTRTPEQLATVSNSVYYLKALEVSGEFWVAAATQSESGLDSTAPPGARNTCGRTARVLIASSEDDYNSWFQLASYDRTRAMGDTVWGIPAASGYIFLEADPELGFVINPYNMGSDHGSIDIIAPDDLSRVSDSRPNVQPTGEAR